MKPVLRMVGAGVLAVGLSLPVAVVLALPTGGGQADAGPVVTWPGRASSMLAGRLEQILRLVRCPTIQNNE